MKVFDHNCVSTSYQHSSYIAGSLHQTDGESNRKDRGAREQTNQNCDLPLKNRIAGVKVKKKLGSSKVNLSRLNQSSSERFGDSTQECRTGSNMQLHDSLRIVPTGDYRDCQQTDVKKIYGYSRDMDCSSAEHMGSSTVPTQSRNNGYMNQSVDSKFNYLHQDSQNQTILSNIDNFRSTGLPPARTMGHTTHYMVQGIQGQGDTHSINTLDNSQERGQKKERHSLKRRLRMKKEFASISATKSTLNKMNYALSKLKQTNRHIDGQNQEILNYSNQRLANMNMKLVRYVNEKRFEDEFERQFRTVDMAEERLRFRPNFTKTFYASQIMKNMNWQEEKIKKKLYQAKKRLSQNLRNDQLEMFKTIDQND